MFKQAELTANGIELIDQSSSTYNYKSVIESILSSGKLEEDTEKNLIEVISNLKKNFKS